MNILGVEDPPHYFSGIGALTAEISVLLTFAAGLIE